MSNGWVNYMSGANVLEPMRGYAFQFGNSNAAKTLSVTGVVNNGPISLSLNNNNQIYTNGFHLVSNPYPSPINWDAAAGWTKVNMDNALYYFDTDEQSIYTSVYNTYINGISSDGKANNFIPAMQAFFVRVSDGTYPVAGTLAINNKARLTHLSETHRKINSIPFHTARLNVKFAKSKIADPCVIYFSADATATFNKNLDAIKLMNTSETVPSIYSLKGKHKLSIQSAPPVTLSSKIPLGLAVKRSGEHSFEYSGLSTTPSGLFVYLYDSLNKKYIDLKHDPAYRIQLSAGEHNQQFSLIFSWHRLSNQLLAESNTTPDAFQLQVLHRNLFIVLPSTINAKKSVQLSNVLGQKLIQKDFIQGGKYLIMQQLSSGVYFVTVIEGKIVSSKKILIGE